MAKRLVWLALLALPFHAIPGLALQPAELLALPLVGLAALRLTGASFRRSVIDAGILAWLLAVVFSAAVVVVREGRLDAAVQRDVATTLYLTLLYLAVRVVADQAVLAAAPLALVVSATIAAVVGVVGFVLSELGVDTTLAFAADSAYPYLGRAARARALTATPNMLASILGTALLLLAAGGVSGPRAAARRLAAGVLALGFALTFSKTVVALAAGFALVRVLRRSGSSRLARFGVAGACLAAAAVFFVFSHVVILRDEADRARLERSAFLSGEALRNWELGGHRYAAYPTSYFFQKRASLIAIGRSWPWGIGPGRHPTFAGQLQREGAFPKTLWLPVPHSSYTGAAAELGFAGILGLGGFLAGLALGIRRALGHDDTRPLAMAAAGVLAMISIEALATDVMHFRHYVWLAALVASAESRAERD